MAAQQQAEATNTAISNINKRRDYAVPRGLTCPYCDLKECARTALINKRLTWMCEDCFNEIIAYEIIQAAIRKNALTE